MLMLTRPMTLGSSVPVLVLLLLLHACRHLFAHDHQDEEACSDPDELQGQNPRALEVHRLFQALDVRELASESEADHLHQQEGDGQRQDVGFRFRASLVDQLGSQPLAACFLRISFDPLAHLLAEEEHDREEGANEEDGQQRRQRVRIERRRLLNAASRSDGGEAGAMRQKGGPAPVAAPAPLELDLHLLDRNLPAALLLDEDAGCGLLSVALLVAGRAVRNVRVAAVLRSLLFVLSLSLHGAHLALLLCFHRQSEVAHVGVVIDPVLRPQLLGVILRRAPHTRSNADHDEHSREVEATMRQMQKDEHAMPVAAE
mmetsp:Transcript_102528/g.295170  ORF Transcript_102528/g.295170 Transcript_102528/m.295170 type:complete len:315 (+) Transcript_102528:802-1746(+)